jgi:hypothetical protein
VILSANQVLGRMAAVCVGWYAVIAAARYLPADTALHGTALAVHLLALAVGFGAVLTVDATGLLTLAGRRSTAALLRTAARAEPLIWGGFVALAVSGVVLRPDLGTPLTAVNLVAALVAALNGVWAGTLRARVPATGPLPAALVRMAVVSGCVSQLAWWTSILVGTFG